MKKMFLLLLTVLMAATALSGCTSTSGKYKPGTYTASAQGYGGDVKVTVTVDADKITAVTIDGPDETPAIGGEAIKTLTDAIKSANSDKVDGVSGATVTSDAVKKAAGECLAEAKA